MDLDKEINPICWGPAMEWERPPDCCDKLKTAILDPDMAFIFVSYNEIKDEETGILYSSVYFVPTDKNGEFARSSNKRGIQIQYCPWCGKKILIFPKERNVKK